jgi:uncharacterized membrane protein
MKDELNVNKSTRNIVVISLFIAITFILANTPLGMINLPMVAFTISHIPTIIISIVAGPITGAIVGCFFGLMMMFKAITSPTGILDPYFMNPLVSVVPRVIIGLTTYYTYFTLKKFNMNLAIIIGSAVGSLTNTIGCMGIMYLIYFSDMVEIFEGTSLAIKGLISIILVYGGIEMLASVIVTYLVVQSLKKVKII